MSLENLKMVVEAGAEPDHLTRLCEKGFFARFSRAARTGISLIPCLLKQLFQCALVAALAFSSYWLFSKHILQSVEVVGTSMAPTLHHADLYLMDRWTYLIRDPQPSDIVVLRDPEDSGCSVKRIIGRSGDSIFLKNGLVYVNGRLLDEPYLLRGMRTYPMVPKKNEQWIVCGKDQYFVMGDNRGNSHDSRVYGAIPRENILGTVTR